MAGCGAGGSGGPSAAASADPGVTVATAAGETLAFVPSEVTAPGRGPFLLTFRNGSSLAHNLVFTGGLDAATRTIVEPGAFEELVLEPPGPGAYPFVCTIHAEMAGTLIVGGDPG